MQSPGANNTLATINNSTEKKDQMLLQITVWRFVWIRICEWNLDLQVRSERLSTLFLATFQIVFTFCPPTILIVSYVLCLLRCTVQRWNIRVFWHVSASHLSLLTGFLPSSQFVFAFFREASVPVLKIRTDRYRLNLRRTWKNKALPEKCKRSARSTGGRLGTEQEFKSSEQRRRNW